jgi:hypothetical protein
MLGVFKLDRLKFQNLDLGENLFKSWSELVQIGRQLKYLKVLTVSENRLQFDESSGKQTSLDHRN